MSTIDELAHQAAFGSPDQQQQASFDIWQQATRKDIIPASINDLYFARGRDQLPHNFTVPAMNLRGMAYDTATAAFQAAKNHQVGALIFELARSEMSYTNQPPLQYATTIMAAALKTGWSGPLFIQCDHFQAKVDKPGVPKSGEIQAIKNLVVDSVNAGFYNIDIDMSTLVDLSLPTEEEQQQPNIKYSLELANFIRQLEPQGVTISLGGEIGHIGGKNSNIKDFRAYMSGFAQGLQKDAVGISKVSVATGSSHGGVVLSDGSLADVDIDFSILKTISKAGRQEFHMGGAVQHGASTLPDEYFSQFTKSEAIEVHLATGFQNLTMDHPAFPPKLLKKMYQWLDDHKQDERKDDWTNEQFHYKLRKKAWGQFKQETWNIPEENKAKIRQTLADRFSFFYQQLNVVDSMDVVNQIVKPVLVEKTKSDFKTTAAKQTDVQGLAD